MWKIESRSPKAAASAPQTAGTAPKVSGPPYPSGFLRFKSSPLRAKIALPGLTWHLLLASPGCVHLKNSYIGYGLPHFQQNLVQRRQTLPQPRTLCGHSANVGDSRQTLVAPARPPRRRRRASAPHQGKMLTISPSDAKTHPHARPPSVVNQCSRRRQGRSIIYYPAGDQQASQSAYTMSFRHLLFPVAFFLAVIARAADEPPVARGPDHLVPVNPYPGTWHVRYTDLIF